MKVKTKCRCTTWRWSSVQHSFDPVLSLQNKKTCLSPAQSMLWRKLEFSTASFKPKLRIKKLQVIITSLTRRIISSDGNIQYFPKLFLLIKTLYKKVLKASFSEKPFVTRYRRLRVSFHE